MLDITALEAFDIATRLFSSVGADRYPVAAIELLRRFEIGDDPPTDARS